ncbi:DUF6440 family protein [Enterococcus sp. LJL99]
MSKKEPRFILGEKKMIGHGTVLIDQETGVNYLMIVNGGVCPLYNSDGTLIVTKVEEN